MKTVGEFKKAGLVFVEGDACKCVEGVTYNSGKFAELTNRGNTAWVNFDAISFAWRENTEVKPEFIGAIDAIVGTKDSNQQIDCAPIGDFAWCSVIKWRPSLNQPSIAESDTKESAIHKAWVALGGSIRHAFQDAHSIWHVSGASYVNGEYYFSLGDTYCLIAGAKFVCTVKEFIDYCEKMAAEEKRMEIIGQNGNDGLHYDSTAQQVEALAVKQPSEKVKFALDEVDEISGKVINDKPIFTQAMAVNGELPPVVAKCIYVFMENGSEYTGSIAAIDGNVIWFKLDGGGYKTCFGKHKFKAVDNRTDREKAIDEMLELDLWATDREFLEAVYDAGYRKC